MIGTGRGACARDIGVGEQLLGRLSRPGQPTGGGILTWRTILRACQSERLHNDEFRLDRQLQRAAVSYVPTAFSRHPHDENRR